MMFPCHYCQKSLENLLTVAHRTAPTKDGALAGLSRVAGVAALGQLAGRTARVPPAGRTSFAAAHRVRHRVLRHAADMGLSSLPAHPSRFADHKVHVIGIANS